MSWGAGVKAFKLRPKHHYLWHLSNDLVVTRLSPRLSHCWEDERALGRIKKIAVRCHGATVTTRALQRYSLALAGYLAGLA